MDINLENYLSPEEMKSIATKIFTEKITNAVQQCLEARHELTSHNLVGTITSDIITKLTMDYVETFRSLIGDKILIKINELINPPDEEILEALYTDISWKCTEICREIIANEKDKFSKLVYDKLLSSIENELLSAFAMQIINNLNLDVAAKEILDKYAKGYTPTERLLIADKIWTKCPCEHVFQFEFYKTINTRFPLKMKCPKCSKQLSVAKIGDNATYAWL